MNAKRPLLTAGLIVVGTCGVARAHHSYADFDRCRPVALEGEIADVQWVNPHVVITLKAASQSYRVEWLSLGQLAHAGFGAEILKPGEHVVITGAPHRNFDHVVSLLSEIRRPSDGWAWSRRRPGLGCTV